MSELPEPLTPPDCDLRDYEWMPIDINRLLTSETWILGSADECKAALTLWCEAWRQLPAASLPDDDRMLAHLSRVGSGWKRIRDAVMRSWIKCADGRLYHPVVAEKARESWALKLGQKQRTRAATEARKNKKHNVMPNDEPTTLQRDDNATSNVTCDVTSTSRRTLRSPPDQTRPDQNRTISLLRYAQSRARRQPNRQLSPNPRAPKNAASACRATGSRVRQTERLRLVWGWISPAFPPNFATIGMQRLGKMRAKTTGQPPGATGADERPKTAAERQKSLA